MSMRAFLKVEQQMFTLEDSDYYINVIIIIINSMNMMMMIIIIIIIISSSIRIITILMLLWLPAALSVAPALSEVCSEMYVM